MLIALAEKFASCARFWFLILLRCVLSSGEDADAVLNKTCKIPHNLVQMEVQLTSTSF